MMMAVAADLVSSRSRGANLLARRVERACCSGHRANVFTGCREKRLEHIGRAVLTQMLDPVVAIFAEDIPRQCCESRSVLVVARVPVKLVLPEKPVCVDESCRLEERRLHAGALDHLESDRVVAGEAIIEADDRADLVRVR